MGLPAVSSDFDFEEQAQRIESDDYLRLLWSRKSEEITTRVRLGSSGKIKQRPKSSFLQNILCNS